MGVRAEEFVAQELRNPNPPEEDDQELARHLLERGVGLLDEEPEAVPAQAAAQPLALEEAPALPPAEAPAEARERADPDDVAPLPRPAVEPDTDAFNRRVNNRVDRTYIGQLVDIERDYIQKQQVDEERERQFRGAVLRMMETLLQLETERGRREEAHLRLEERRTIVKEEELRLKKRRLEGAANQGNAEGENHHDDANPVHAGGIAQV